MRWVRLALLLLVLGTGGTHAVAQGSGRRTDVAPRVWFFSGLTADYTRLSAAPEQWPRSLATVGVLQLSSFFIDLADDRLLRRIIALLRERNIDLALEGRMLTPGARGCGEGIESYGKPGAMRAVAARLKALGGRVRFISMDEPLWFGHVATSYWRSNSGLCRASVEEVAANAARVIAEFRAVFPDVEVGDTEVLDGPAVAPPDYPALLERWAAAFARATGRPLAFMTFDIPWTWENAGGTGQPPWAGPLREAAARMRAAGLRVGVVYNGSETDTTNTAWVDHAMDRVRRIEGELGLVPDEAAIASWVTRPDRVLPEWQPGTLTNLVLRYADWRAAHSR